VVPDTTRPTVTTVGNVGENELSCVFSEGGGATALDPGDYVVSGGVNRCRAAPSGWTTRKGDA